MRVLVAEDEPRVAAFVAQKVTVEYCRARAGIGWSQLTGEPGFAVGVRLSFEDFPQRYVLPAQIHSLDEHPAIQVEHAGAARQNLLDLIRIDVEA